MENLELTNINFLASAGAAFIIFLLAFYVLKKNPYSVVNKLFAAYALCAVLWTVGLAVGAAALKPEISQLWERIGGIGGILMGPMFFLFILAFTRNYKWLNNFFTFIILIGTSLFFYSWLVFIDPTPIEALYRTAWGWESKLPQTLMIILGGLLWVPIIMALGIIFCWQFYRKTKNAFEKKQAVFIMIAGGVPLIFGVLSGSILPQMGLAEGVIRTSKILFSFSSLVLVGSLAYAALKYRLFTTLTPATTADAVIETMKDALIVINPKGNIELVNLFALGLLGYNKDELVGKSLSHIFSVKEWNELNRETVTKIKKGEDVADIKANFLTKEKKLIPISFSGASLKSESGGLIGIIIVAKDTRETMKLIKEIEKKSLELAEKVQDLEAAGQTADKTRLATLNILEDVEEARAALQERVEELEKFNKLAVGRELKMIELKEDIKRLKETLEVN